MDVFVAIENPSRCLYPEGRQNRLFGTVAGRTWGRRIFGLHRPSGPIVATGLVQLAKHFQGGMVTPTTGRRCSSNTAQRAGGHRRPLRAGGDEQKN